MATAQMIADDIALSRAMLDADRAHPELEALHAGAEHHHVPLRAGRPARAIAPDADEYLNALNKALLERIQRVGETFVSNAVVRGRFLLRACIVNFQTGVADVDAVPEITARLGREVDAALRSSRGDA